MVKTTIERGPHIKSYSMRLRWFRCDGCHCCGIQMCTKVRRSYEQSALLYGRDQSLLSLCCHRLRRQMRSYIFFLHFIIAYNNICLSIVFVCFADCVKLLLVLHFSEQRTSSSIDRSHRLAFHVNITCSHGALSVIGPQSVALEGS